MISIFFLQYLSNENKFVKTSTVKVYPNKSSRTTSISETPKSPSIEKRQEKNTKGTMFFNEGSVGKKNTKFEILLVM